MFTTKLIVTKCSGLSRLQLLFIIKRMIEEFKSAHAEQNVHRKPERVPTNWRIQSDLERNFRSLTELIPKDLRAK